VTERDKASSRLYEFGPFCVDAAERVLLRGGRPVPLSPKLFDTLLALVERSGHLVEKAELMELVWPETFVEESNLSSNVSLLRKALGEGADGQPFIETVPRRGYRFAAGVRVLERGPGAAFADAEEIVVRRRTRARILAHEEEDDGTDARRLPDARSGLSLPAVAAPLRSLAVLPFALIDPGAGDEYLGLGLADALITQLGNTGQLVVRPTSAVRKYTDPQRDSGAVGRELGVDAVLEGAVQQAGGRLRVTVQMVGAQAGVSLWADKFSAPFTDIFDVQDSISEQVARALAPRLTGDDRRLLRKRYTENTEAYQAYLRGRYFWNKRNLEGFRKAVAHFRQAIEHDPAYALAYSGLSDTYAMLASWGEPPPREGMPLARAAAERALEIDPELSEAHASLGNVLYFLWDCAGAERSLRRAIELNPNYATAHNRYAQLLVSLERFEEAEREIGRAHALDPLSPMVTAAVAGPYLYSGRFEEAAAQCRKALELDPDFIPALFSLANALSHLGRFDEALAASARAVEASARHPLIVTAHAGTLASAGRHEEARRELDELLATGAPVLPYSLATVHARLGDRERALECLERACDELNTHLNDLNIELEFAPLRDDPRFRDLVRRVGLPEKKSKI
jgi:DNA-binding winged helix-turn-helix (wHTH) protein/TolB-like protein/Tfp pilus assembly protein PilF